MSDQRDFCTDVYGFFVDLVRVQSAALELKKLRESASPRLSVRAVAEALDMPASSYAWYEDPKRFKKPHLPVEFARSLIKPFAAAGIDRSAVLALAGIGDGVATTEEDAAGVLDLVPIGEIDLAYGLGGTFTDGQVEVTIHHFPRVWIESISSGQPAMLTIARGRGDSMEPTIKDGDMVIINRGERIIREQDAIWALTMGDIGMIKRVRVRGERVTILSDNDRVPPDEVHASEVNVVGRIDFVGSRK